MKKKCQETQLVNEYYGITQDPNTKDFMIITKYYALGDLKHYLSNEFYNIYKIIIFSSTILKDPKYQF